MPPAFVNLLTEPTCVVEAEKVIEYRVTLELPLSEAAHALGLSVEEYAAIERGALHFKDGEQWTKAKALLKNAASHSGG